MPVRTTTSTTQQPRPLEPTHPLVTGQTDLQLAKYIRQSIREAKEYARWRRTQWSKRATVTQLSIFVLSAASTILLGLAQRDVLANIGFVCSALVSAGTVIEPFFNWRSRWVLAEEALASWHKLEDELCIYVASHEETDLDRETILQFDRLKTSTWERFSEQWIGNRRSHAIGEVG